ncbi:MAG: GTPase [Candidatus Pacearchaeota archaeon]
MASTNQSPFYQKAEQEYLEATSDEERIACLEIMIKECPKHKSSENMLRNLTNRLKKLKEGVERRKKAGKGGSKGIRKAEMQCVLTGFANTGKSSVFNKLTGLNARVSAHPFTTTENQIGMFKFEDVQIQIIDTAPFPNHDKSLLNSTDTLLIVVDSMSQIPEVEKIIWKVRGKKIFLFNKEDLMSGEEKRKTEATIRSKFRKCDFVFFSKDSSLNEVDALKKKIFESFPVIRIYTKEPKKEASKEPMILERGSTLRDAIEKIRKGMSGRVKMSRIWGPSSKFGGQVVGLDHELKDKDIVEFKTQ